MRVTVRLHRVLAGLILFLIVVLVVESCNAAEIERRLEESLARDGVKVGYDPTSHTFASVSSVTIERPPSAGLDWWLMQRRVLSLKAELSARREILRALDVRFSTRGASTLTMDADSGEVVTAQTTAIVSKRALRETAVYRTLESVADRSCSLAVAVVFSLAENDDLLRHPVSSTFDCGRKDVWAAWAAQQDLLSLSGCRKFRDDKGAVRLVGIGFTAVEPNGPILYERARAEARANLAFAIAILSQSDEIASRLVRESFSGNEEATSFDRWLISEIRESANVPTGLAPEVFSTIVSHPVFGGSVYVSLVGYEPDVMARLLPRPMKVSKQADSTGSGRRYKILNPVTGKFE